jgi:hypothetical protein
MDTAKAANLFTVYKDADLYDFINAPVGKGLPITQPLRPLIAIPVSHYIPIRSASIPIIAPDYSRNWFRDYRYRNS